MLDVRIIGVLIGLQLLFLVLVDVACFFYSGRVGFKCWL